ncbi:hypothetical protein PFNF54_01890 [Plasmodium falciparum NF54]|uniref:Uncharacterized protein n=1 Tax=Plasmodium falciparum (isolate NF54) TaxID=5843 RepID=W7JXG1_PLAFO|nr:hypothetical protein PFNF54_01890 [Plasmodium falciparum NF54]
MNIKTDLQYTCVMFFPRFLLFYYDSMMRQNNKIHNIYNIYNIYNNVNKIFLYINIKRDYLNMNT